MANPACKKDDIGAKKAETQNVSLLHMKCVLLLSFQLHDYPAVQHSAFGCAV